MIDKKELRKSPMGKALLELNSELQKKNLPHITLNVIGGFALILHEKRNINDLTDIDYIGEELPDEVKQLSEKIGRKYHFASGWINNDVMASGFSMDDFMLATGQLHFEPYMDTDNITVNVLSQEDLLKLKIIAIDTSLIAIEYGGDFTRMKDLPDIIKLMRDLNITYQDINETYTDFILGTHTITAIKTYETGGETAIDKLISNIHQNYSADLINTRNRRNNTNTIDEKPSKIITEMLENAFSRAKNEISDDIITDDEPGY